MRHFRDRSLGWVFVSRMIGIICFLIVLVLANILLYYIANPVYHSAIALVDENFWLLILIAIIFLVGDIFGTLPFPINLPAPVFKAFGSVFSIAFILKIIQWIDTVASMNLYNIFWFLSFLIVPLVFLVVLATGHLEILRKIWWQPKRGPEDVVIVSPEPGETSKDHPASDAKSWEELGAEFRLVMFDILQRFRDEVKKK